MHGHRWHYNLNAEESNSFYQLHVDVVHLELHLIAPE